jgi:hypothetical protein
MRAEGMLLRSYRGSMVGESDATVAPRGMKRGSTGMGLGERRSALAT